jgi:hypothetical protein
MAIYNEILVPRIARGIQKLFGMKGDVPAKQLAGEIMPVHLITTGVETRYLDSWNRWSFGITSPPLAANTNGVQLRNPAGSNMIGVIERFFVYSSTVGGGGEEIDFGMLFGTGSVDLGTHGAVSLDARVLGPPASSSLVESDANTSPLVGNLFFRGIIGSNVGFDLITSQNSEIVIAPGSTLRVVSTLANANLLVSAMWRERLLEEAERQ